MALELSKYIFSTSTGSDTITSTFNDISDVSFNDVDIQYEIFNNQN